MTVSRLTSIFASRRPALMPFVTAGFPSLGVTREVIPALERAGADIIEIGFPFTDPIADGPVIAESMHQALQSGVNVPQVFGVVREVRPHTEAALVAMVSDSIITRYGGRSAEGGQSPGPEAFMAEAADAGFDGVIIPDIDLDAAVPVAGLAQIHGLDFILLIAPTSGEERIRRICSLCSGFVYVLARVGITGERGALDESALRERLATIRRHTPLPLAVGFGIAGGEQARRIGALADGVIVGSALVKRMSAAGGSARGPVEAAEQFTRELAGALHPSVAGGSARRSSG